MDHTLDNVEIKQNDVHNINRDKTSLDTETKQRANTFSCFENGYIKDVLQSKESNGTLKNTDKNSFVSDYDKAFMIVNGEKYSPDSEANTLVGIAGDKEDKHEKDDYDTHSDSVETLAEDSPHDLSQEKLSSAYLPQSCLTKASTKREIPSDLVDLQRFAVIDLDEDISSTANHEDIAEKGFLNNMSASRPESLSLPRPLQYAERNRSATDPQKTSNSRSRILNGIGGSSLEGHKRTRSEAIDIQGVRARGDLGHGDDMLSKSLPHGTIMRKGELIEFVADDLQEKIKRSSPMSRESGSIGSRRSSERSIASTSSASTSVATSSGLSCSPSSLLTQSPDVAPPIDPTAIMELEMNARRVADSVDLMMGNICSNLHKMSAITVGCLEAYKTSVDITCDSVDSSIKSMYTLMAKCEELSKVMNPVHQIGGQIKEIKRLLDLFEAQLAEK